MLNWLMLIFLSWFGSDISSKKMADQVIDQLLMKEYSVELRDSLILNSADTLYLEGIFKRPFKDVSLRMHASVVVDGEKISLRDSDVLVWGGEYVHFQVNLGCAEKYRGKIASTAFIVLIVEKNVDFENGSTSVSSHKEYSRSFSGGDVSKMKRTSQAVYFKL